MREYRSFIQATRKLTVVCVVAFLDQGVVQASCENSITVRAPGFDYFINGTAASANAPLGQDAVSDSIYYTYKARNFSNLARGLAVASQIYSCVQTNPEVAEYMARVSGGERLGFRQNRYHEFRRVPHSGDHRDLPLPDRLASILRGCATDTTAILYSVQIGSFKLYPNALARKKLVAELAPNTHTTTWDSTRIVDWWNWSCAGDHRPNLFILAPEDSPGPGYKVLHGLFVDRKDAVDSRHQVRRRFQLQATVVPIRITGPVLYKALRPGM